MYISDKRIKHEIEKIKRRASKDDLPKLELLEELEVITYDQYVNMRDAITDNEVAIFEDKIKRKPRKKRG